MQSTLLMSATNVINMLVVIDFDPKRSREKTNLYSKTNRQFVIIVRVIWCNESMANCIDHKTISWFWTMHCATTTSLFICKLQYVLRLYRSFFFCFRGFLKTSNRCLNILETILSAFDCVSTSKPLANYV